MHTTSWMRGSKPLSDHKGLFRETTRVCDRMHVALQTRQCDSLEAYTSRSNHLEPTRWYLHPHGSKGRLILQRIRRGRVGQPLYPVMHRGSAPTDSCDQRRKPEIAKASEPRPRGARTENRRSLTVQAQPPQHFNAATEASHKRFRDNPLGPVRA